MNGRGEVVRRQADTENEVQRRERLTVFRPESAPTLLAPSGPLDMSPEASLSGPPSAHDLSTDGMGKTEYIYLYLYFLLYIFLFPFSPRILSYQ